MGNKYLSFNSNPFKPLTYKDANRWENKGGIYTLKKA